MMNPLGSRHIGDKLPVLGRQAAMAKPQHLVALHSAAPHRTVFRPALRSYEDTFDQPFRYPPVVRDEREIKVDQRVSSGEPFPRRSNTSKTVDDPLIFQQQICV